MKEKVFLVVAAVALLGLGGIVSAEAYSWTSYGGHSYTLTDWGSWQDCENEAVVAGGHLVAINDAAENAFITEFTKDTYTRNRQGDPGNNIAWIGLNGGVWSNGEPVTYTNMLPGYPEDKVVILGGNYGGGGGTWAGVYWHDEIYDINPQGVIEVVPEPTSLMSIMLGIAGLGSIGGFKRLCRK